MMKVRSSLSRKKEQLQTVAGEDKQYKANFIKNIKK